MHWQGFPPAAAATSRTSLLVPSCFTHRLHAGVAALAQVARGGLAPPTVVLLEAHFALLGRLLKTAAG